MDSNDVFAMFSLICVGFIVLVCGYGAFCIVDYLLNCMCLSGLQYWGGLVSLMITWFVFYMSCVTNLVTYEYDDLEVDVDGEL